MPDAGRYRFHQVLSVQELYGGVISFGAALTVAQQVLDAVDGPIDAIVGYWELLDLPRTVCTTLPSLHRLVAPIGPGPQH